MLVKVAMFWLKCCSNIIVFLLFLSVIIIFIIKTKQCYQVTIITCQNRTCIHINPNNDWTTSHILCFSPPPLHLSSQGPIAPTQWAVQAVWVRAKGALNVYPQIYQPPTRGKEHSLMTYINWWTTGPEMPWTSHRFTAAFLFIHPSTSCFDIENVPLTVTHQSLYLVYQT